MRHGSKGEFEIIVDMGKSNVDILYKIELEEEKNVPNNIIFKTIINEKEYKESSLRELFNKIDFSGNLKRNNNKKEIYKIYWEWPFEYFLEDGSVNEEKDKLDFENGISNLDYIFSIKITGVQEK